MPRCALLFTDLVDSTCLVERLGDERAAAVWLEHDRGARQLLARFDGQEIDRSDGFFLIFGSVCSAMQYACAYQRTMVDLSLSARIGVHAGAVTLRSNDESDVARGAKPVEVDGLAKHIAARIMALAAGGQILLSAAACAEVDQGNLGTNTVSHGHYRLKGISEPLEIFELSVGPSAFPPPPDSDKVYRVVRTEGLWLPRREVRHNLPPERDAFFGRTTELHSLAGMLELGARFITVLGTGGTGKTRFVRRYGLAWLGEWPGGVVFCDLSEARSPDGIYYAIASALGVPLGKDDPAVQLGHAIAGRGRCLLILDNFEQVAEHAAASIGRWLDRASEATFLVTSRERLQLAGEVLFMIEPLPLETDALDLFVARAETQRADFFSSAGSLGAVADVVRLLDGLPLAIELAAARVRVMSAVQIAERLKDRFKLLAGARGAAKRQATLEAAIDWSWDLLNPWEKAALAQCSVFEGGFGMGSAEAVLDLQLWPEAPPLMDVIQALVDKSLLRAWVPLERRRFAIDEPFFGMYLSIHEYASAKLAAYGEEATTGAQVRHGTCFANFGSKESVEALSGHGGVARRASLALEIDNLVVACRRALAREDASTASAAYEAAWQVLEQRGPLSLALELGQQVLAIQSPVPLAERIPALLACAVASRRLGFMDTAIEFVAEGIAIARALGDRLLEAKALACSGSQNLAIGDLSAASNEWETALVIARDFRHRKLEGQLLALLASAHGAQGRSAQALHHYEAALSIYQETGDRAGEAIELGNYCGCLLGQGQFARALELLQQAIAMHRESGHRAGEALAQNFVGNVHTMVGRLEAGQAAYQTALSIAREIGARILEGRVLGNLANSYGAQGRTGHATELLQSALAIHREVRNRGSEGIALVNLGRLAHEQGRLNEAVAYQDAAAMLHRETGNLRMQGVGLGALGHVRIDQGLFGQARDDLSAGETLLRKVDDRLSLAELLSIRGLLELACSGDVQSTLSEIDGLVAGIDIEPTSDVAKSVSRLRSRHEQHKQ